MVTGRILDVRVREANEHCGNMDKVMIPVADGGAVWAEFIFRCLDANDPEAQQRQSWGSEANVRIEDAR
jgi:hypothetical protein